jgi:predicted SprT family Zn-dependent metalloprotease
MSLKKRHRIQVGEPVRFVHEDRELRGVVARLDPHQAFILDDDDRQSYRVPLERIRPAEVVSPAAPDPPWAAVKGPLPSPHNLSPGERVAFACRGGRLTGNIVRLNPRRAHVLCDDDAEYAVPYGRIERLAADSSRDSGQELTEIKALAARLFAEHGLEDWAFAFDHATRRAGCCDYRRKRISLALQFARRASDAEIADTLLHEIAHALVGKKHNHDAVWRAKAQAIGGSGERCHDLSFSPPRYIVTCRNGCWTATAERRRRNIVCRECRGEIVYQTYTEQRWQERQDSKDIS